MATCIEPRTAHRPGMFTNCIRPVDTVLTYISALTVPRMVPNQLRGLIFYIGSGNATEWHQYPIARKGAKELCHQPSVPSLAYNKYPNKPERMLS